MDIHRHTNGFFKTEFGVPFRNGIFGSGNKFDADEYGNAYFVIPMGEVKTLWSPLISDFWITANRFTRAQRNMSSEWEKFVNTFNIKSEQKDSDFMFDIVHHADYKLNDLKAGLKSEHEVMVWCEKYMCINTKLNSESLEGIERIIQIK